MILGSELNNKLNTLLKSLDLSSISATRKAELDILITYIVNRLKAKQRIRLIFICTHNSRRSHLGQIWAKTIATYFKMDEISSYSGGTEETALFPKVAETLIKQGFEIHKLSEGTNPVYAIKYGNNDAPIVAFSKKYDHKFNPQSSFAAIMTCSSAEENCPYIRGADQRISLQYEDPKLFDGSDLMDEKYTERSLQIASELFYVFSELNNEKWD